MTRLLLVLPFFALACGTTGGGACTEIACESSMSLTVTDSAEAPVTDLAGDITFGDHVFHVDCTDATANDPQVTCTDGVIHITIRHPNVTTEVALDLTNDAGDTATASGIVPEWTENAPNGDGCPPVCEDGVVTVALDDV